MFTGLMTMLRSGHNRGHRQRRALCPLLLGALGLYTIGCQPSAPPQVEPARQVAPEPEPAAELPAQPAEPPPPPPAAPPPAPSPPAAEPSAELLQRLQPSKATLKAPERYTVLFETTKGDLYIDVRRSWAPLGADRFFNLVKLGYFEDIALFRVIPGFVAQGGLHGVPAVNAIWRAAAIQDDPVTQSNTRGMLTFATSGPNSRTTQFFLNLGDNANLDAMGFAPIGRVRDLSMLDKIYSGYGEGAPAGEGPMQAKIQREGNAYLRAEFPKLDFIEHASIADTKEAPAR
jgi:peptidyl-prolyl cis-trans isomerase A (cyclophilin A)